ncbi:class I SAM-dependent methyltransferase [Pararhodospirillum oryzae]|uniref:Methyltransferase domain-containing protein n=1 Tax=Pararhodospirillum oryzae TaxID=478448 RepID=A0A512HB62_9PROT|nr:class I SAM-dependent methyltransferase [Pararhodospirillum oryzae]GEO82697.1 hypothetical protein ROR02_28280 [Pararhodospirillum oryzae]
MDKDDQRVIALYTRFFEKFGPTHRALDWTSAEGQNERFSRFLDLGLENGDSVLDVGCGLGDFLAFTRERGLILAYTGLDMTPAMIDYCQATYPNDRFHKGSLLDTPLPWGERRFDWVVASGIFAHRRHEPWAYMCALVDRMKDLALKGVAFNAQSTRAPYPELWTLFHADPDQTREYCTRPGWTVIVRPTRDRSDFTTYLWRTPPE